MHWQDRKFDFSDFAWPGSVERWKKMQDDVRQRVIVSPLDPLPRYIAGADCAFSRQTNEVRAAAVVYDRLQNVVVDQSIWVEPCRAPYVPTYLSFREVPALIQCLKQLTHAFGAVLVDGQGLAHPRRCGLATHLGVMLDLPAVGCAKSRLIGTHAEPRAKAGGSVPVMDREEEIGVVLRTRDGLKPLFVSVGHRSDLPTAIALVRSCCTRYRLPEPTRLADRLSKF